MLRNNACDKPSAGRGRDFLGMTIKRWKPDECASKLNASRGGWSLNACFSYYCQRRQDIAWPPGIIRAIVYKLGRSRWWHWRTFATRDLINFGPSAAHPALTHKVVELTRSRCAAPLFYRRSKQQQNGQDSNHSQAGLATRFLIEACCARSLQIYAITFATRWWLSTVIAGAAALEACSYLATEDSF